jgi:hypothetical protein
MIVRALYTGAWNNAQIADALDVLATAGNGVRFAYFYADRVVMSARRLRDTRGVLATVSVDELVGKDDYFDIINRVHQEIYAALMSAAAAMEKEMPAGAERDERLHG